MNINLVESLFCYTFPPDKSHLDRLVAHCRVFFDKRSGKAERIEQFIAECRIENGLQFVTRFFLNSPDCLYLKKSCEFLQSFGKTREEQNKPICFFFRDGVTSRLCRKVTKKACKEQRILEN